MRSTTLKVSLVIAGLLGSISASPAVAADSFGIAIAGPPAATVGQSLSLQVSGKNPPPAEYWYDSYFSVEALPAAAMPACPAGHEEGSQAAVETVGNGGGHVTPVWVRERPDASGAWSASLAYTPKAPGRFLLCAYTNDGFTNTLAAAATAIQVNSASTSAAVKKHCKKKRHSKKCRKRR
jgi:hypothetical protein